MLLFFKSQYYGEAQILTLKRCAAGPRIEKKKSNTLYNFRTTSSVLSRWAILDGDERKNE